MLITVLISFSLLFYLLILSISSIRKKVIVIPCNYYIILPALICLSIIILFYITKYIGNSMLILMISGGFLGLYFNYKNKLFIININSEQLDKILINYFKKNNISFKKKYNQILINKYSLKITIKFDSILNICSIAFSKRAPFFKDINSYISNYPKRNLILEKDYISKALFLIITFISLIIFIVLFIYSIKHRTKAFYE